MTCRYCAEYIRRADKRVENFREACRILKLNPDSKEDEETIVRAFASIGQFGSIRLARRYPWVTDEAEFHLVTIAGLHFYWMLLDTWEEIRSAESRKKGHEKGSSAF